MPEQPNDLNPENHEEARPTKLRLFQINLNKSEKAHLDLLNNNLSDKYDIMLIQEPYITAFNGLRTPTNFRPVCPSNRFTDDSPIRSAIWVNKCLETKNWKIIGIPNSNDITAIQVKGTYGKITIFNIYNDCTHSRNEAFFRDFLVSQRRSITEGNDAHMLWTGDFNRHHPLWDDDKDIHLFTTQALRNAEGIINLIAEHNMEMSLPKGIPTLQHMRSKRYSRPDNVFCSTALQPFVTKCEVKPQYRPTSTDHFPIVTQIDLPQSRIPQDPSFNFRTADWDEFRKTLTTKLQALPQPGKIRDLQELNGFGNRLTQVLQTTIEEKVTSSKPRPDAKRWWNSDLSGMRKELNRLRTESYKNRTIANHSSHRELRRKSKIYGNAIISAKRAHWTEYLEGMTASDIWTANKYLKNPVGDGGLPRIPTIRIKDDRGRDVEINDNEAKAKVFAKIFFPPPPEVPAADEPPFDYPEPLPDPLPPTGSQIEKIIRKLSPYKAPGPDGIPNIVLQKCYDLIADHLLYIYQAILELDEFYDPWREFITLVIRKPDKPNYELPKAHRPIALISTMAKVLTALIAENISRLVETHQLLPKTHFGGRPGRTTTDAIHYLAHKIKQAWANNQVASVLFLDVEGAFPNAVTDRLIHNLKTRRIPKVYTNFIRTLLTNRRTKITFDDFVSDSIDIDNGIGQGDPLSMLLYIIYNADLLEIIDYDVLEDAIGYVDDIALVAVGNTFDETTARLQNLMSKPDGALEWSRAHNSKFEISKSAVLHFTRRTEADQDDPNLRVPLPRPNLVVNGQVIKEVQSYKYLGIQIDAQLRWKEQTQRAIANATKWLLQYRRLTRPLSGTSAKLMRQLYVAVALPKITYGLDIWYTPPNKSAGQTKNSGSVAALRQLQKTQRIATLAIAGALRSTPTDFLDAHVGLFPIELALLKANHRSTIRILTLPASHPLYKMVASTKENPPTKHASPLANLIRIYKLSQTKIETIIPPAQFTLPTPQFSTMVAVSRKESIKFENGDEADFKVFSDGSGLSEGIGAAAILYAKNRLTPTSKLKMYLGPPTKRNTFEAELVGAILAVWLLRKCPDTIGKTVSLYIDNQAVISSITNPKATSGQFLSKHLNMLANASACRLGLHWISSHSKVRGNEKVDELAKEAASGLSSARIDLPHLLRTSLPSSASAVKQRYHERMKKKWAVSWEGSDRRRRIGLIDDNFPFNSFRTRTYALSRSQASLMIQIRCGHIPLNGYLFRIGKSETEYCQGCMDPENGTLCRETVNHFLFECASFDEDREELAKKINRSHLNLRDIMSKTNRMSALATYINKTGRFKNQQQ